MRVDRGVHGEITMGNLVSSLATSLAGRVHSVLADR